MKKFNVPNINTSEYWDEHQTALDFGLRQRKYLDIAGSGERIIELGCGLSPTMNMANFNERYGVDFSPETIKRAKELYPDVRFILTSCTDVPLEGGLFDAVIAGEVIEHMEDPDSLINEMTRLARRGGKIILSTPHLEFEEPEHLWEFDENWFIERGFNTEVVHSERFPGRSYIFAYKTK